MMKKGLIVLFLISNLIFGQEKITKNLGDFNELKVYRGLRVVLIKSDIPKVTIEGEKSKEVIVKNVNGVLKITMKVLESFSADQAKVSIFYNNDIDIIDVNEGALVSAEALVKQEKLVLKSQEAGKIELHINTSYLEIKVVSGGQIDLEGFAKNQTVKVNTGGIYEAKNLETEYTNISASTGAIAAIKASKLVDANANLGAMITVKGNPEEVKKKETLGGYVKI